MYGTDHDGSRVTGSYCTSRLADFVLDPDVASIRSFLAELHHETSVTRWCCPLDDAQKFMLRSEVFHDEPAAVLSYYEIYDKLKERLPTIWDCELKADEWFAIFGQNCPVRQANVLRDAGIAGAIAWALDTTDVSDVYSNIVCPPWQAITRASSTIGGRFVEVDYSDGDVYPQPWSSKVLNIATGYGTNNGLAIPYSCSVANNTPHAQQQCALNAKSKRVPWGTQVTRIKPVKSDEISSSPDNSTDPTSTDCQVKVSGANSSTTLAAPTARKPAKTGQKPKAKSVKMVDKSTQTSSFQLYVRRSSSRTPSPVPAALRLREAEMRRRQGARASSDVIVRSPPAMATKDLLALEEDTTKAIFSDLVNEMFPAVDCRDESTNLFRSLNSRQQQRCIVMVVTLLVIFFSIVV
ncbi:PREDICTED: uncharacterized protein LOC106804713 [Priapulus caudatus]|uniref:Uncharacterized protein LOC106804713 n=1 Tax=Priapulus caudatus TaxID=37621 RepID=A0ABM1DNG7_PRICU|nr:PREDICTED: uncharacterized protein LOC106804713 [Priapulus caudatus]